MKEHVLEALLRNRTGTSDVTRGIQRSISCIFGLQAGNNGSVSKPESVETPFLDEQQTLATAKDIE